MEWIPLKIVPHCVKITNPYPSQLIHSHMVPVPSGCTFWILVGYVNSITYCATYKYKPQPIVKSSRRLSTAMKHTFSLLVAVVIVGLCYSQDPTPGNEICYIIIIYIILFIYFFYNSVIFILYNINYKQKQSYVFYLFIYRFPVKHAIE